jgi:glutathione S-transferase
LARHGELLPKSILTTFEAKAPNFWKWANRAISEKSVTAVWDEEEHVRRTLQRINKIRADKAAK